MKIPITFSPNITLIGSIMILIISIVGISYFIKSSIDETLIEMKTIESNILGNLTDHRKVTNITRDTMAHQHEGILSSIPKL